MISGERGGRGCAGLNWVLSDIWCERVGCTGWATEESRERGCRVAMQEVVLKIRCAVWHDGDCMEIQGVAGGRELDFRRTVVKSGDMTWSNLISLVFEITTEISECGWSSLEKYVLSVPFSDHFLEKYVVSVLWCTCLAHFALFFYNKWERPLINPTISLLCGLLGFQEEILWSHFIIRQNNGEITIFRIISNILQ